VTECIALLRGINVGKAKPIAMSDLRELFIKLGHGCDGREFSVHCSRESVATYRQRSFEAFGRLREPRQCAGTTAFLIG
jgi:hypothetical protein